MRPARPLSFIHLVLALPSLFLLTMADAQTPFLEAYEAQKYDELRKQPLPPTPASVPWWKTRKGRAGIAILALAAIIGAVVGVVESKKAKKSNKSDAKSDSASGAGGTSSNGTVARAALGVAAVTWPSNVRLYTQKDDGFVYEATGDQSGNWDSSTTKLFQAKAGTPLAAIVPSPSQIHLYSIDTSNMLQEYVYNNGWSKGTTQQPHGLTPITSLAAVTWTEPTSQQIRVYYQKSDNTIQELMYSSSTGWETGWSFGDHAYPGTSFSGAIFKENVIDNYPSFRVYWQDTSLGLNEYAWCGSGWSNRDLQYNVAPNSGISAVAWLDGSGNSSIRVYFEDTASNFVQEVSYNDTSGWVIPPGTPTNTTASLGAPVSAVAWTDGGVHIRVYVQSTSSNNTTELVYSGGWSAHSLGF
ncbi:hypothetical protein BDN72DRAFT_851048 [Pluteus cervinus]|uniref:Uncharacterized protein n=1 Tax=Pluteus cervinus TaxID=181527 RepID=A0ACD3A291_9AGAR|nr:hypothetical protein BDN72DRAFT_851048 [Pluteus cervinus]